MSIRVLHFSPFLELSGANRSMLELLRESARHAPTGLVAMGSGALRDEAEAAGVEVFSPSRRDAVSLSRPIRLSETFTSLLRGVIKFRPDVIHSNSAIGNHYVKWFKRIARCPLVTHQRDNYANDYFHSDLAAADRIISITQWVHGQLPESLRSRSSILLNPAETPDSPWKKGPSATPLRIGMAGRCVADKGFDILLDAIEPLVETGQLACELWGLDDSPYGNALKSRIQSMGKNVSWQPFRNDIETMYRRIDLLVVPSRYPEPMGRMAIEAMAGGTIVMAANHGGLPEVVKHRETGYLFTPQDPAALRREITELLNNPAGAKPVGDSARMWVEKELNPAAYYLSMSEIYSNLFASTK